MKQAKPRSRAKRRRPRSADFVRIPMLAATLAAAYLCMSVVSLPARAGTASSASSSAKKQSKSSLWAAYHRAFEAMIQDITNLDKTFTFAELAVQVGDYEGAISAFERMLLIDPNLPQVKVELGALYMRLGSYRMAQTYLNDALASPNLPKPVRAHIDKLLAEAAKQIAPNHFLGSITLGARYQSNANAGPSSSLVEVGGALAILSNRFTSKRDWNGFLLGQATDIYDFGTQSGTTLETNATAYGADQETQKQVNVGFAELTSGPRFKLFPSLIANATVKPYGIADIVSLGHARYYWAGGGGIELTKALTPRIGLDITSEFRNRVFQNSSELPFNDLQTGLQSYNRIAIQEHVTAKLTLLQAFIFVDSRARYKPFANDEYSGTVGVNYRYLPLISFDGAGPWVSSLAATRTITPYDAADPTINPNVVREDRDWEVNVSTTIPVTSSLALAGTLGYFRRNSTLPNFRFTNKYGSLAVSWRF